MGDGGNSFYVSYDAIDNSSFCVDCDAVNGSSFYVNCNAINSGSFCDNCDAVVPALLCANCIAVICVLSDCWASSTFALGFLVRPLGGAAGWTRIGVSDTPQDFI